MGRTSSWLAVCAGAVAVAACSSGAEPADTAVESTVTRETPPVDVVSEPLPTGPASEPASREPASSEAASSEAAAVEAKDVRTRADGLGGDGVQPAGFTTVAARVTAASGEVCDVCLWLADDEDERSQGLMGVTDLGDAVGMAFVWDEPVENRFFMFDTPTPLSIAWFDVDGGYVTAVDMEPCLDADSSECARYEAGAPYVTAVEMFQGELGAIGIGPGATLELFTATGSPDCVPR